MVEHETQASSMKEMDGEHVFHDSSTNKNEVIPGQCYSYEDSGIWSSTSSSSVVQHCFPRRKEPFMHKNPEKVEKLFQSCSPFSIRSHGRIDAAQSLSESSYQFPKEALAYLDDIEEFRSPNTGDSTCQDQRLFMFNSFNLPKEDIHQADHSEGYKEQHEADSGRSKKTQKTVRKRMRNRSVHHEYQSIKDIEYDVYFDGSLNSSSDQSHRSHEHRKHQKKFTKSGHSEGVGSNFVTESDQLRSCSRVNHNYEVSADCSLEHPCYFSATESKDEVGQPPNQSSKAEQITQTSGNLGIHGSCNGTVINPWTKMAESLYLRAMTMPPERIRDNYNDNILRSNSFPLQQSSHLSHVHPKLPDYDDVAAKFTALKKAHLQTKQSTTTSFRSP